MQASAIEVKIRRDELIVQAIGRNAKGQRYIKGSIPLKAKKISDPNFKAEMEAAVIKLLESDA